jgi:hypothetical protein
MLVEHSPTQLGWNHVDELIASQHARHISIIKNVLGSWKAQSRSSYHHRFGRHPSLATMNLRTLLQNIGKETSKFNVVIGTG